MVPVKTPEPRSIPKAMGKSNDLLVLDPNNEFFRYLNQSGGE